MNEDARELIENIQDDIETRYGFSLEERACSSVICDFDEAKEMLRGFATVEKERPMHYSIRIKDKTEPTAETPEEEKTELDYLIDNLLDKVGAPKNEEPKTGYAETLEHIIYIPQSYIDIIENPEAYTKEDAFEAFAAIVEEVSHFCYTENHYRLFNSLPKHLNTELVGSLDKYYTMQNLIETDIENESIEQFCFESNADEYLFNEQPEYFIGHRLAQNMVGILEAEDEKERTEFLRDFYGTSNAEQINYLLYDLGITFSTFSEAQAKVVQEYFKKDQELWPVYMMG
jgi:hypothetical protein